MNRRRALATLTIATGGVMLTATTGRAEQPKPAVPGAVKLDLDKETKIDVRSSAIKVNNSNIHIVSIGTGTFRLDKESRLTATLKAAVNQYAKIDFWISTAVFDAAGKLLGTAGHKESVQYI